MHSCAAKATVFRDGHTRRSQTVEVLDKDQRPEGGAGGEGEPEDPMADVACLECGRGDDDEHLLLCDGVRPGSWSGSIKLSVYGFGPGLGLKVRFCFSNISTALEYS